MAADMSMVEQRPAGGDAGDSRAESPEPVLATVARLIISIIGEQYVLALTIDEDTSFNTDLELESIEFVALSAALREHYGEQVDFVTFLADKDVEEIIALRVGDVVRYIESSLRHEP